MDYQTFDMEEYIGEHIDAEPALLAELDRYTHTHVLAPRMLSGHLQGRLLKMLVRMANPRQVLEIGTFTGYSALCMAEGLLRPEAHIHTIEIDDELEPIITRFVSRSAFADRITLHIGDALSIMGEIQGDFDFVFIDGNKRDYPAYYKAVMPRLSSGGYIVADNILWDGKVVEPVAHNDGQTKAILEFNDLVAHDDSIEKVILPIRDGLTLIRKK
ncbi:MAG: class I SAM-dependent methyltransferase [Bacteroidales bacterium]|nr:class I SAM-dependent methyltransferase [Bacteroidales bacterium]